MDIKSSVYRLWNFGPATYVHNSRGALLLCAVMIVLFCRSMGAQSQQPVDTPKLYPDKDNSLLDDPDLNSDIQSHRVPSSSLDGTEPNQDNRRSSVTSGQKKDADNFRYIDLLPPDPPTEFQQMVKNSTGQMLPIYGAQLFRRSPSTFAPVDKVPVTPDYAIGPGDELIIQVWGQVTLNSRLTVDRSGNIYLPQVGTIRVAGVPFGQLRDLLKAQMGRVFRNFDLNVNMGQLRSIQVFVVGQARRPGSYTVSSLSTLVNALFSTGGPTPAGSLRHIQLKRSGRVIVDFDLYALLQDGDKSSDVPLLPGDVIYIPPVGPQVAVAGSVNSPGIYELKSSTGSTISDVLQLATGLTNVAFEANMKLQRIDAHRIRSMTDLSADSAWKSTLVRDGDILLLMPIVDRYRDGVILRGNVANPGHYAWKQGMRVSDLLPDRESLVTRDYWLKRERLGKPSLTYLPTCPSPSRTTEQTAATAPKPEIEDQNCEPASQNRIGDMRDWQHDSSATGLSEDANEMEMKNGVQPDKTSRSGSSVAATVVASTPGQFEAKNDVVLSEPDIDWSYAVIERQDRETLTTSLLSFNLGRLVLQGDNSQNLLLQPNDVVTIFSKADIHVPHAQQTRLVRLEGEFVSAGMYSVAPGETLRDLVNRAGGLTKDAYLYGSEFTRESTRKVQQMRLNEYIDQIALEASVNSANSANRSVSALDSAASAAAAAQSQNIIAGLRLSHASGRIVLQLHPDSNTIAELPAIELEAGDKFVVPHRPSTVSVAGAVYNPNTFLYDPVRRLRDYVSLAGGANRDADRKSVYVIRADGSVVSRRQMSTWSKDHFEFLHIYPGDTVIVPLNLNKGTTLRNVVDVAQIVGQFGIAAAASSVVF